MIIILTLALLFGIPRGHDCKPPIMAAKVYPYPVTASGDDFKVLIFFKQVSIKTVVLDGNAVAMLRMHQAADNQTALAGWIKVENTASVISFREDFKEDVRAETRFPSSCNAHTKTCCVLTTSI